MAGVPHKAKRSQVIVDDYMQQIVRGDVRAGDLLPTEPIMEQRYGVSRTAVREAMQSLAGRGMVRIRQGSGSVVTPRSEWNVLDPDYLRIAGLADGIAEDVLEALELLEPAIAGLAATRADEEQRIRLRELATRMKGPNQGGTGAAGADQDVEFHHLLAECTRNPVLISLHSSITHLGRTYRGDLTDEAGSAERAIFWHGHIVDAIEAGDAGASQDAMRMHMRQRHTDLAADSESA